MPGDLYFKSPFRGRRVATHKPYVSEHERLDVDPIEYPTKDPEELIRMNKKAAAEKQTKEKRDKAKSLIEQLRSGDISEKEFQAAVNQLEERTYAVDHGTDYSPQMIGRISSGQGEDSLWTHALEQPQDQTNSPGAILYPETFDEPIKDSEIASPVSPVSQQPQEEIIDDLEEQEFGFDQVKSGEFILIYRDSVVNVGTMPQIKETLSSVLMEGEVSLEEFIILKRVSAEMGIFIGD